ncbi:MAG TPA: nucleotide exchange factor GrpE [Chloroflexota bacterium]|nr:nucleotide exchange factor GrpE [Chloroflexota bacterium]
MYRDFDEWGRPSPGHTINIPRRDSYGRQPVDLREGYRRLQQELHQAQAQAAAWQEEAHKWHTAVQQQDADRQKLQAELAAARQTIASLEAKPGDADSWQEKYMRLAAEMENSKKRLAQRYAAEAEETVEKVLRDMLAVADNLERALAHAAGTSAEAGIALTLKAFTAVMQQHGVRQLEATGRPFDPAWHEAVGTVATMDYDPGVVTAVVEHGYLVGDKLLRPARVFVATATQT